MPDLLKRLLVLVLALRAVAAPVSLRSSGRLPSEHGFYTVNMRSWPPQRLERFSSSSKLLRLCTGKNRLAVPVGRGLPRPPCRPPVSGPPFPSLAAEAGPDTPGHRLAVCLRC